MDVSYIPSDTHCSDRLRAVQCPSDMIDQIGGWATAGVGQGYGEGYSVSGLYDFMLGLHHEA